jgi:GNAT superfamily N-acetyltransferase
LVDQNSATVAGYYTLANTSIVIGELPTEIAKKLPKYERAPAVLLGRLAVDKNYQGKGLGIILLFDALRKCLGNCSGGRGWGIEKTARC